MSAVENKKSLENELRLRSHALAERVKELECIHSVSDLLMLKYLDIGEVFQRIVELLPSAFQYPETACARISLKSRQYQSKNYRDPLCSELSDIVADNERVGVVEVGYIEPAVDNVKPHFLPEERDLLITVAQRLGEVYSLKEAQRQLSTYQQHLRSLALELTLTEERERRQLALHLHDNIGQSLAVTKLKLENLRYMLPEEHQDRAEDIISLIQQIIADTRTITAEISPPILYELKFDQALVWLCDHFRRQFGLNVEVEFGGHDIELSEGVRVMLFRSIRELLNNVLKHAQATKVKIQLEREGDEAHTCVSDNGVGFDLEQQSPYPSASGGFGLFSIRERFTHLGGRMSVDSKIGEGTRIHLWVPVTDSDESERETGV